MFFLWVNIRATDTTMENTLNKTEGVSKKRNKKIGKAIPALIDESETYPEISKTKRKTPKHEIVSNRFIARSTPKMVATPLPPLKPANTGKIWPRMTNIPARI
jgi:hypothetical protein